MGKSSGHKQCVKNNIFKVAGSKSLKAKNKAKAVTADRLKQLNFKNKGKIDDVDEQLNCLNFEVRQPPKEPETNILNQSRSTSDRAIAEKVEKIRKYTEAQENCRQALDKLCSMEM